MDHEAHYVAVFGGAVSGSEAAFQLAQRGIYAVVFDQGILPYGKIEDGLPKWHAKLRDKEEAAINERLSHPLIQFVPSTKLGQDVDFTDVVQNWGFSAVLLATGAWKDRPLDIPGIERFVDRGLYYQNSLSYWFNHYHEPNYNGPVYEIRDNAVIIGGGLASIDMAKMVMMELVKTELGKRGIETHILELDKGIDRVLEKHGLRFEELGLKGCTLYYRRRNIDMPLSPGPSDTPEQRQKLETVRAKVLENAMNKFFFRFEECCIPVGVEETDGELSGLAFHKTAMDNGKLTVVPDSGFTIPTSLVISSIGSIPEPIAGIPLEGQTYKLADAEHCRLDGFDHVFALGNAVTGRGNIKESFRHGQEMTIKVMDHYLAWSAEDYEKVLHSKAAQADRGSNDILASLNKDNLLSPEQLKVISDRVKARQEEVGYQGPFKEWAARHVPKRLEEMVEAH